MEASGTSTSVSARFATEPLYVSATVNGDLLSVTVWLGTGATFRSSSYLVHRGVPGDFSGIFCAA